MTEPPPAQGNRNGFLGGCLIAAGALLALLSGLCTAVYFVAVASNSPVSPRSIGGAALVALIFGGIPILMGAGLIWGGVAVLHPSRKPDPKRAAKTFE
ncbi:MAG: hypothetical protein ACHP84_18705 [Caulobacterales bacterium]